MYVVKPVETEMIDNYEWEGSINKITHRMHYEMDNLSQQFNAKNEKLQDTMEDFMRAEQASDRYMKAYVDKVVKSSEKSVRQEVN